MLIITGQVGRSFIGTDAFQETDIFGITLPIVKHSYIVRKADDISRIVTEALYLAQSGRPGPVLIDIPKDVGLEEVKQYQPFFNKKNIPYQNYIQEYSTTNTILNSALKLFKISSQPLLYIGGGTINSRTCPKIIKHVIKKFSIPTTNTLMGKGIIDDINYLTLGMLGMHGTAYANFAVSECDLLIALGARFDDRVTGKLDEFASLAKVIHVDIDPAEIGKNRYPQLPIIGDIKKVLHQLLKNEYSQPSIKQKQFEYWIDRITRWKKIYPLNLPKTKNLLPQQIIYQISIAFPTSIYTTDVGQHQMWSAQFINLLPKNWVSSSGLGTMGFGLPAAIGAAFARSAKQVICISGDSSFQMCLQELATVKQYDIPIHIFIINNKWQGMVRQWQQSFYGERYSHSYMYEDLPNFEALAKAYGLKSYTITNKDDFTNLLKILKNTKQSTVIDVKVESEENCYPMVSPGKSNAQMIGISKEQLKQE